MKKIKLVYREYIDDTEEIDELTYLLSDGAVFEITTKNNSQRKKAKWLVMDRKLISMYKHFDKGFEDFLKRMEDEISK